MGALIRWAALSTRKVSDLFTGPSRLGGKWSGNIPSAPWQLGSIMSDYTEGSPHSCSVLHAALETAPRAQVQRRSDASNPKPQCGKSQKTSKNIWGFYLITYNWISRTLKNTVKEYPISKYTKINGKTLTQHSSSVRCSHGLTKPQCLVLDLFSPCHPSIYFHLFISLFLFGTRLVLSSMTSWGSRCQALDDIPPVPDSNRLWNTIYRSLGIITINKQ